MIEISDADLAAMMEEVREAARQEILPRFLSLTADAIRTKTGPDDLVTDADIGTERVLSEKLLKRFPGALVVGEEAVAADPAILDRIGDADWAVIIDPVDGTWNFANGVPVFGSMLAIVHGGVTLAGIIHYPVTGDFVVARPGQGAWHIKADGTSSRLKAAAPQPIAQMDGFVALPMLPPDEQTALAPRVTRFARTSIWRCSAYEYRLLAQGAVDFMYNAGLMPWDHAAGVLLHAEAGGYARLADGRFYSPVLTKGRLLLAPDEASWHDIRTALVEPELVGVQG